MGKRLGQLIFIFCLVLFISACKQMGKPHKVYGLIVEIDKNITASGYIQNSKIAFEIGDSTYLYRNTFKKRHGFQSIGNLVEVTCDSLSHKVLGVKTLEKDQKEVEQLKVYTRNAEGYDEFKIINDVCFYTSFKEGGFTRFEVYGTYDLVQDTLVFNPFTLGAYPAEERVRKYVLQWDKFIPGEVSKLTELETERVYL